MGPGKTVENPGPASRTEPPAHCPHLPVWTALQVDNRNGHTVEKGLNELSKGRKVIVSEGTRSPWETHLAPTGSSWGRESVAWGVGLGHESARMPPQGQNSLAYQ